MFPTTHPPSFDVISLPLIYPISDTLSVPLATPPQPLHIYTHCPLIVIEPLADSSLMAPSFPMPVLPSPVDLPIVFRKGTYSSHNPYPIFVHHILLLFPLCLLFLFLKLCTRPSLIRAGNMQWLKKLLLYILSARGT